MSEARMMFNGASFVASPRSLYEAKGIWVCGGCGNGSFIIPVDRDEVCAKCQAIEVKKMRNFGGLPERNQMSGWSCNGCSAISSGVLPNDRALCPKCMDKVDEMDMQMVFAKEHLYPPVLEGDMLEAMAESFGVVRKLGETDAELRQRTRLSVLDPLVRSQSWHLCKGNVRVFGSALDCFKCDCYLPSPELQRILDDANRQVESCECAKDKFGFEFHERWCPDWVHPFEAAAAMQAKLAAVPEPDYRTQGDKLRMGARK